MAERPALLRRLRLADGALLAALAVAFLASGSASAARLVADHATDPSRAGSALAWLRLGGAGALLVDGDARIALPAQDVAIGGRWVATLAGGAITVRDRATGAVVAQRAAPGASQLAVSGGWLVWRAPRPGGGDRLYASRLPAPPPPGTAVPLAIELPRVVAGGIGAHASIDRPALSGDRLVYATSTPGVSRVAIVNLATRGRRVVLATRVSQLSQPALDGGRLLFVQSTSCNQRLLVDRTSRPHRLRTLFEIGTTAHRDAGREPGLDPTGSATSRCPRGTPHRTDMLLWTTALAGRDAYVTLLRPGAGGRPAAARIVRVPS